MVMKLVKTLAAGAIAVAGQVAAAQAADTVTFQLDWLPGGDKAPIYICVAKGFCADEGIEVKIEPGRGSSEAITKLSTGVSDVGTADIGALMAAKVTEGVPVTAVMSVFNKGPHAFFVLKDSGITEIKDVAGKKVATSPFTSSNVFLPLVLKDVGLTEDSIELTKADPGALGPMLMTGATDVAIAWMTNVTIYSNQAKEAGKEVVALPWDAAGLELYSASLLASDAFLKDRPDVAKRFVSAFKKSLEFVKANPKEAAEAMVTQIPELSVADVEGTISDTMVLEFNDVTEKDGLGVFEPSRLAASWARVSAAQGLDASALDPETVVDRSFLPTM